MRRANVFVFSNFAGELIELDDHHYQFEYAPDYNGPAISLTMPITQRHYDFETFPPFFDGLLPEGPQLEALLRTCKLDKSDTFGQLMQVGRDVVGGVTVIEDIV